MCSLCGVLGGRGHWTESTSTPEAFASRLDATTRRRERQERTGIANRILTHYGLTLKDWGGSSYILSTKTGRTVIVDNLSEIWIAAEALTQGECDPLDEGLLADLGTGR
jgi:hypothetical protein